MPHQSLRWYGKNLPAFATESPEELKTESRLKFHNATGEAGRRFAEGGVVYACCVTVEDKRRKVELVEDVEEVSTKLKIGALAQAQKTVQAELLHQTHVNVEVPGTAERVATDARWIAWNKSKETPAIGTKDAADEIVIRRGKGARPAVALRT